MMISNAGSAALAGMQRGMEGLRQNAAEIASVRQIEGTAPRDISQPLVKQTENLQQVEASAKVLSATDDMIGRLLDIKA